MAACSAATAARSRAVLMYALPERSYAAEAKLVAAAELMRPLLLLRPCASLPPDRDMAARWCDDADAAAPLSPDAMVDDPCDGPWMVEAVVTR